MSDSKIIEAVLKGDTGRFRELVDRYQGQVAATVYGMLGRCQEAEDVGQETFIRFYQNLKNFRGDAAVSTYLVRIAINLSLNELKRRKRRRLFQGGDESLLVNLPDEAAAPVFDDSHEQVHRALQKLEPKFRTVVVLRLLEGYTSQETADILDLPLGTVLSRLTRAQQKLKKILISQMEIKNETRTQTSLPVL